MSTFIFAVIIIGLYFAPSCIAAYYKKRNSTAIFLVNLFFGWSIIGWIVALVWAASKDRN